MSSNFSGFQTPLATVAAIDEVSSQFNLAKSFGSQAFNQAQALIGNLINFNPQDLGFDVSFTVPDSLLTGFTRPEAPAAPDVPDFDVEVPDPPAFSSISIPTFGNPPEFTGEKPFLDFSGKPQPFAKTPPTIPELFPVSIPESPDLPFPELPELEDLNLPAPPDITEFTFDSEAPVFDTPIPDMGLNYTFTEYSPELMSGVQREVARMLDNGGLGLPPAIEQMIFDRARDREDKAAMQALDEVDTEFASRGFSLPSGIQAKRRSEVQQRNQENRSRLNADVAINNAEVHIDTLRFAIQQGIAAENLTSQIHFEAEGLKLQAASTTAELALQVFSAAVQVYNAQVQAYQVDAQVFRELIEAELTKVERFRAQLEAERLKGELNQQKIELYIARLQGLNTLVAIYSSEVDAAGAIAQTNNATIQGFAAEIDAFRSEVQAKQAEFGAWSESIRGELGKVDAFRAEAQAFSARTQAFAAGNEAKSIAPRLQLEQQALQADQYRSQIAGVRENINALATKSEAITRIFSGEAAIYEAEGRISAAEAESNTRQFLAKVEEAQIISQTALAEAELRIQKLTNEDNQVIEALRGATQAASQLAAASLSAIQVSAQISGRGSDSNSWNYSEDYYKDIT